MAWIGVIIIIITFIAIMKKYETRTVLFVSGLVMCIISGQTLQAFDFLTKTLVSGLVPIIVTAMGFAAVINYTKCDEHFSYLALKHITRFQAILIPGTVFLIWFVSISLTSPAGLAAAIGPIIIPVLIRSGVYPAMAASAVLAGTWGSFSSVSSMHIAMVSELSGTAVPTLVIDTLVASIVSLIVCCVAITAMAIFKKEHKGYVLQGSEEHVGADVTEFKVNYLKALMPLMPIIILLLSVKPLEVIISLSVSQVMIICTILTCIVTRQSPFEITKKFCDGIGNGYGSVLTLIAAAAVFTGGLGAIGLTGLLVGAMKESTALAKFASAAGPFFIGVLSGSGDAGTLAFNTSITPFAQEFGMKIEQLGMTAYFSGGLGRTMSPVAAVVIILAQIAGVSPIELSKRVTPAMLLSAIVGSFMLLYM